MEDPAKKFEKRSCTLVLVPVSLQVLLWSSLAAFSIQLYFLAASAVDASLFLADILCIAAAGTSLSTIISHGLVVRLRENVFSKWACKAVPFFKIISLFLSCTAVLLWTATCGLGIILTLAAQPTCRPASSKMPEMWMKGRTCVLQRSALVLSMLALVMSSTLCLIYNIAGDPYNAGLLGCRQPSICLSPSDFQRSPQMVKRQSTLSFKCRSATSLIFVSSPLRQQTTIDDQQSIGLGIKSERRSIEDNSLLAKSSSDSSTISGSTIEDLPCRPLPARTPLPKPPGPRPLGRISTTYLAPPLAVNARRFQSERRGISFASRTSSIYSRNTNDDK